jgi:geranylgeranyl transferase type-2 subunit beta
MDEDARAASVDELADRIREGLEELPARFVRRQAAFLRKAQARDGGFPGRRGGSDLYYTSFGLRLADVVAPDEEDLRAGVSGWLQRRGARVDDAVDCLCLLDSLHILSRYGDDPAEMPEQAAATVPAALEARRTEGGWAKEAGGPASVYHTFLSDICYLRLALDLPEQEAIISMVRGRQQPDGGFADLPEGGSGVNPTAAAVDLLWRRQALEQPVADAAASYIASMQTPEGGLAASRGAPCADLLSTFTGAVALGRTGIPDELKLAPLGKYVKKLAAWRGGFRGALPDTERDVEYTWYGVGLAGLLSRQAAIMRAERAGE